ncbi:MAG: hypothetical protein AMS15_08555 [Planctomycetes bacterium DG_23]|nr:MAG: hypothetical protein AMS15_08555 [Planctomycetes bacterium DG_23]
MTKPRIPKLSWATRITIARIVGVPIFIMAMMGAREASPEHFDLYRLVAFVLFFAMGAADVLDGMVARGQGRESRLGGFLDPMGDKLMICSAYVLLAGTRWPGPRIHPWLAVVVISRDVFITLGFITVFLVTGRIRTEPNLVGKACIWAQAILVMIFLLVPTNTMEIDYGRIILFSLSMATFFFTVISGIDYTRKGIQQLFEK